MFEYSDFNSKYTSQEGVIVKSFYPRFEDDIVLPDSILVNGQVKPVIALAKDLFKNQPIKNVYLPDSLVEIGESCFEGTALKLLPRLGMNLRKISSKAFFDCKNMSGDVIIPQGVIHIGIASFGKCENLSGYCCLNSDSIPLVQNMSWQEVIFGKDWEKLDLAFMKDVNDKTDEEKLGEVLSSFIVNKTASQGKSHLKLQNAFQNDFQNAFQNDFQNDFQNSRFLME